MRGLAGKNVVVTGAASGIGRSTAARLLEEGARVLGADITPTSDRPGSAGDEGAYAFTTVDVSDEDSVKAMMAEGVRLFGRIDGAVNAAGVAGGGAVHMVDVAEWHRVVDVNLFGTYLVAKHALTQMLEQDLVDGARGAVVTIASIEGIEGTAGGSAYSASKGGVVILTKNMAIDYAGMGIRVNTVCPGFIDTPMTSNIFGMVGMETPRHEIIKEHKLGRFGQPEEIAAAACFLLSSDASFITGHSLIVDGGYTAGRDHGVTEMLGLSGP
ncbi:MAG TPA: SDR family NAD(P)-dependent oxidoreductase [Acidimicrobiales bacterium]|jgi:NAD(P)-dependent dehydrogenase (short-subunit alcohol dehydrogenase family)